MDRFIKNIVRFAFFSLIFFIALIVITNRSIQKSSHFKLPGEIKYIIAGHSHTKSALNDSLLDNCINLSLSGESLFYTYLKLRKTLNHNQQINTVYLAFAYNITSAMNAWTYGDVHLLHRYPKFSVFMNGREKAFLFNRNKWTWLRSHSILLKDNLDFIFKSKGQYLLNNEIGGYEFLPNSIVQKSIQRATEYAPNKIELSELNMDYLRQIKQLCDSSNVQLFLLRTPLHEKCTLRYHEHDFQEFYRHRLKDIPFVDLANFPIDDNEYWDLEHLNYKGAEKFSEHFNLYLNSITNSISADSNHGSRR